MRTVSSMTVLLLWLVLLAPAVLAEEPSPDWQKLRGSERFAELAWLVGEWRGYGEFSNGHTNYIHKSYAYDLAGMFFVERTLSMSPPPEPATEYEIHQDLTMFYRNHQSGALKAQAFYVESFVTAAEVTVADGGDTIVIESQTVENAPEGMRSRYTITRSGEDGFTGTFELAMPGQDFTCYQSYVFQRVI